MAASSKAEYLKKYLSDVSETKKKKKKKNVHGVAAKGTKSRIVDDDVDFKSLLPSNLTNTLEEDVGDNDPVVAEVIDERPEHVKLLEKYRSSGAWKVLGKDDEVTTEGKRRHDSESDESPPRRRHDSDSDQSPPRKQRHDSDSDQSLPRKKKYGLKSQQSPPRRQRHDSDSDQSPPRKQRHDSDSDQSPPRKQRHDSDSDQSPPRKQRHDSDSDQSPPRKQRHDSDSDQSPPRKQRHDSDSDQSPPRKQRHDSDSDQSPPRRGSKYSAHNSKSRWGPGSNNDLSPQRKLSGKNDNARKQTGTDLSRKRTEKVRKRRHDSDSDQSPPRKSRSNSSLSNKKPNDNLPRDEKKTLSGKKAGLSSAKEMRREADEMRRKEDETFRKIDDEVLGKGAATVFRDKKSGKIRNLDEERRQKSEEAKLKQKEDEKFHHWGKGLKQIEHQSQQIADALHEADKPLARYKDDEDLDQMLRNMDRAEDPMLAFMKKKKSKTAGPPQKEKPRYKGPAPPPNRFGILPGYRWDGVDRSNGFERQVFAKQAEQRAISEQKYKWSTEDM